MANTEVKNAQSDVLLSDIAQGATSATLTNGNFGTPSTQIYLTFDYDVAAKYEVKKATVAGSSVTSMTHISGANVAHTAGCKIGRMINAEVIKDITDITDNHETRLGTAETSVAALQTTVNVGGWSAGPSLTYGSVDGPTSVATVTGDVTTKFYPGVRIKCQQTQAISNYWTFDTNNADSKGSAVMTNIGTPTYTAGKFGNALTLNGTNQALTITDAAGFHLGASGNPFSFGKWIKTSNTGAAKAIYQAWSKVTNFYGIQFYINVSNVLEVDVANGTSSTTAQSAITGLTNVCDGNWHYVEFSFKDNFMQVYVDGKLDVSSYCVTPVFNATTYVRIGALTNDGSTYNAWFNGQIDDLFLINGYALDEQTIAAKYAAGTAQGTSDLTLTKYFLVTASSYSNPTTTVTMYGGTDHMLVNSTISNAYYSTQKAPFGFPLNPAKWTVAFQSNVLVNVGGVTTGSWYNAHSLIVPIGTWDLMYSAVVAGDRGTAGSLANYSTLSTANNTKGDPDFDGAVYTVGATQQGTSISRNKRITTPVKTTYYLNLAGETGQANTYCWGAKSTTIIRATSSLL